MREEFKECQECLEDCGACEIVGKVFPMTKQAELLMEKRLAEQAISRYQRRIQQIEKELAEIWNSI